MELADIGYDAWFANALREGYAPEWSAARVVAVDKGRYVVRDASKSAPAELSGRLLYCAESSEALPCVGDWVAVAFHDTDPHGVIHGLLPRKSILRRKTAGERIDYQVIAANIDTAFVVQSCDTDFNLRRLERYAVVARDGGIQPVLVLSKSDLVSAAALEGLLARVDDSGMGVPVVAVSNHTAAGRDSLLELLEPRKTYCLLGSSGVGKTTLLNRLIGREAFETQAVRESDGRGRHTTARRQLVSLDNGAMFIATPGMPVVGSHAASSGIQESFPEIAELARECRYSDCSHVDEAGCAVQAAVAAGTLAAERYQSYVKLMKESAHYGLSYVERRKRDKDFGKFVKSVMKHHRKAAWRDS